MRQFDAPLPQNMIFDDHDTRQRSEEYCISRDGSDERIGGLYDIRAIGGVEGAVYSIIHNVKLLTFKIFHGLMHIPMTAMMYEPRRIFIHLLVEIASVSGTATNSTNVEITWAPVQRGPFLQRHHMRRSGTVKNCYAK